MPDTPSPRSTVADVAAVLTVHEGRFVSPEAAAQVAELMAAKYGQCDPSVIGSAIEAELKTPRFSHFFRSSDPVPGSLAWSVENAKATAAIIGGVGAPPDAQGRINLAGAVVQQMAPQPGSFEAISAARQQAAQQAAQWAAMSPTERLMALGEQYRAGQGNSSGIIMAAPKS